MQKFNPRTLLASKRPLSMMYRNESRHLLHIDMYKRNEKQVYKPNIRVTNL